MFAIEMLQAQQGDALLIEYGSSAAPHRVLIDAGTPPTDTVVREHLDRIPLNQRKFELLIVTHIDTDHIGGVLKLLADPPAKLEFEDVWFNGWRHINPAAKSRLGPIDGEILSTLLELRGWPWNHAFSKAAAVVPAEAPMPCHRLRGGLELTLLSPGPAQLEALRRIWRSVVRDAGLDPGQPERAATKLLKLARKKGIRADRLGQVRPNVRKLARSAFEPDSAVANGSTIAVLAEYEGKSCLLTGDAHPGVMVPAVRRLLEYRRKQKLAIGAFKLPHHGSKHNVSNELLSVVACKQFLFSSNGNIFGHPDDEAVSRVIVNGGTHPRLIFNYRTTKTGMWDNRALKKEFMYETIFPPDSDHALRIEL